MVTAVAVSRGPGGATAFTLAGGGWSLAGWFEALPERVAANVAVIGCVHSVMS